MSESLRERLRGRSRPSAPCRLRVDDTGPAARALEEATIALRLAQARGAEDLTALQDAAREAQQALEGCFVRVTVTALPPADLEALVAAHPPRPDTDDVEWNTATFGRALLLECLPGDLSGPEWEEFLATSCSDGEVVMLEQAALAINVRAPEGTVPKDWMRMLD